MDCGLRAVGLEVERFELDSASLNSPARRIAAAVTLAYRPGGGGIGEFIREWHPDIVHFHNLWPLLTPSALRIARRHGAGVVLTAHNYRFACPGGTLLRNGVVHDDCVQGSALLCGLRNARGARAESIAYGIALEIQRRLHWLERWVDGFVSPSEFVGRMLVRAGLPEQRVHVIPHGLPLSEGGPSSAAKRFALFAGRLSAEKGVLTLLEASTLASEVPLVVVGAGPLAERITDAQVSYLGQVTRPELDALLGEAAFVVAPSEWYENFPYGILEAFAARVPVIGTRIGGIPELVRDSVTGLLVAPNSAHDLAAAMRRLWQHPELAATLGERAYIDLRENYSLERQVAALTELYEAVRHEVGVPR